MSDTAPDGRALRLSDRCRQGLPAVALGPGRPLLRLSDKLEQVQKAQS